MSKLKGSKTEQNLSDAFAEESVANHRYLHVTDKAERAHAKTTLNTLGPSR